MGRQSTVETRFRERVRQERERREWSQADLSKRLQAKGLEHIIPSTVAKIESGDRAVRIDEANALADVFAISIDELSGRSPAGSDLVWVASRLAALARKSVNDVTNLSELIADELRDLRYYAEFDPPADSVDELCQATETVLSALGEVRRELTALADVPIPGVTIVTGKAKR
jgi:transcriptional regulator with XRE-family HTH domain